jgi:hypothetical protein
MRSWIQVLEIGSCRNVGEGCVHKIKSGQALPQGLDPTQAGAKCTGLPFLYTLLYVTYFFGDKEVLSVIFISTILWRGGLVFWADTVGVPYIYSKLSKWAENYGAFFKPSAYLEQRTKNGLPLVLPPSQPSVPYHVCGTICIYLLINIYSKF